MYGIGGFFADVVRLLIVLENDKTSVDHANIVEVDQCLSVVENSQTHFRSCLSDFQTVGVGLESYSGEFPIMSNSQLHRRRWVW